MGIIKGDRVGRFDKMRRDRFVDGTDGNRQGIDRVNGRGGIRLDRPEIKGISGGRIGYGRHCIGGAAGIIRRIGGRGRPTGKVIGSDIATAVRADIHGQRGAPSGRHGGTGHNHHQPGQQQQKKTTGRHLSKTA